MWSRRAVLTTALPGVAGSQLLPGQSSTAKADLTSLSLRQISMLVRKKQVSPMEVTQACLARIERLNPVLNAFLTVCWPEALHQARTAETEIRKGQWRGPLHGVPVALKDLIDTAGTRTTAGSAVLKDRIPREVAYVVQRLKAAGAIILGKLNMHEFAYGDTSLNSFFGPVVNPFNPDRVAGGSSGGSAAAVAAGLCYGALGSDTGGSIRQPAAYCGIAGLKPTYGRVSTTGVIPLSWSSDHIGPMCRSVTDTALLLQAIAGYDPRDLTSVDLPVPDYEASLASPVSRFRLGLPRSIYYDDLDPEIASAVEIAIQTLRKLTGQVDEVQLPGFQNVGLTSAEAYAYHAPWMAATPELYEPLTYKRIAAGASMKTEAYIAARRELDRARREVKTVFGNVDLLITPTTPILPPRVSEARATPDTAPAISLRNTRRFNVYGLPSLSIPCGFTRAGLPVGLQISGPHFGESKVLALGNAYQQVTEWHRRVPVNPAA